MSALADTDAGIAWLLDQAHADGSLSTSADLATVFQSTAEAARALQQHGRGASAAAGVAFLNAEAYAGTEHLSRRIVGNTSIGDSVPALVADLLAHQNTDGSFGEFARYHGGVLDTAHALEALALSGQPASSTVGYAVGFLLTRQNADGSWSGGANESDVYLSAVAMRALWHYRQQYGGVADALIRARDFLLARRNASGLWPETFASAMALIAIRPTLSDTSAISTSMTALANAQQANGSWDDDVFATALALRALVANDSGGTDNPDLVVVSGRVADAQSGQALSGVAVTLAGSAAAQTVTGSDGAFQFSRLATGAYTLELSLSGYGPVTASFSASYGQAVNLGLIHMAVSSGPPATTATVRGVVTDAQTGAALQGVTVSVIGIAGNALTAADGSYQITGVPAGSVRVEASKLGYAAAAGSANVPAGAVLLFSPKLRTKDAADSVVFGTVTDAESGAAIAGATVHVTGATTTVTQTGAQGTYRIEGLDAGQTTITVSAEQHEPVTVSANLPASAQLQFSPRLRPDASSPAGDTAGVSGVAVDWDTGRALQDVVIEAITSETRNTFTTDANGRFEITGLTGSSVHLTFSLPGYLPESAGALLAPGTVSNLDRVRLRTNSSANTLKLTGTLRDFRSSHPDFECCIGFETGIVASRLGADRKPVYAGGAGTATTHGKTLFDEWYRDVSGVNLRKDHTVILDNRITSDPRIYSFASSAFFPLDGQLFGNEGRSHNYHFTYEIHSRFRYRGGEVFTFTGDDDVWVFINDVLVVDLGGVHGAMSRTIRLDDLAAMLGITVGNVYGFELFFAERHTSESNFRIDTSIVLEDPAIVSGSIAVTTNAAQYPANTSVTIQAPVTNQSLADASFKVELAVEDAQGTTVAALEPQNLAPVKSGATVGVIRAWNTGSYAAGHYRVRARLRSTDGLLLDEAIAAFRIVHTTSGEPAAALRITTDRPVYNTTDRVEIGNLARNLTSNQAISDALLQVSVTEPAGQPVLAHEIVLGELAPGNVVERSLVQALRSVPEGIYHVTGTLLDGSRQALAVAHAAYEVREDLLQTLAGKVMVDKLLVHQGDTQTCTDEVTNRGTQAVTQMRVRQTLARLDVEQTISDSEVQLDLAAGASDTLVRSFGTGSLAVGHYTCALESYVNGEWKGLAYAMFRVDPPPIRIDAAMGLGSKGRLLVLLDPPASNGDQADPLGPPVAGAPLLSQQRAWLEDVLKREGWSYTIVLDAVSFMRELRSGAYSVYGLFSETVKLDEQFQREFREAVYRGEGLVEAGSHDQRNAVVDEALGIKFVGKHSQASAVDFLVSALSTGGHAPYPLPDKTLKAVLAGAQAQGHVNLLGTQSPVVTSHGFGDGKAVYGGFDLLIHAAKAGDASLFTDLLRKAPRHVLPVTVAKTNRVVPVTLTLTNDGIATPGQVVFALPAGSIIEDSAEADITAEHELTWAFGLPEGGSETLTFWLRLPEIEGPATIRASVRVQDAEHTATELALNVIRAPGLSEALVETAMDLGLKLANKYLSDAQAALDAGNYASAIKALVQAADELAKSTHTKAPAIRRMVGQALHEVGRKL